MESSSSDAESTARGPAPGQRVFGRFRLEGILGRGGMGVVWRARDETLDEDVALKFLPDAVRWDPAAFEDLKAETRRARQLTHAHIVRIHDFVEDASAAAISMELVDGRTLTAVRLARPQGTLDPADIAPWLPQLSAALDYAHAQARVVHRDLKPSNLMLTHDGRIKIADFGVARSLVDATTRVSMMTAGTLIYMSPQQAMGEEAAPSDDIYALGATLYELLTGKPPFHTGDVRVQLFHRPPDRIASRRSANAPPIPPVWEKTIAACLAKRVEDRPATAGAVATRLSAALAEQTDAVRPGASGRLVWLASALALAVAAATWSLWPGANQPTPAGSLASSDATRAVVAWNLDGDGRDASGGGLHADGANTVPTADRFGRIDRALHFNGSANLEVRETPALCWRGSDPFSVAVWVRPEKADTGPAGLLVCIPDNVDGLTWLLERRQDFPSVFLGRFQQENGIRVTAPTRFEAGRWVHVAATSDGATLRLYLDGRAAGAAPLGTHGRARQPGRVTLRLGRGDQFSRATFNGDLDDVRIWRRTLDEAELAGLAGLTAPPRLALSKGAYSERDPLQDSIMAEFGAGAELADWNELKRWHADDTRSLADELDLPVGGGDVLVQRGGERFIESKRHYFITRFDGRKPDYYAAHDELGSSTLVLGSWFGRAFPLLVKLPPRTPQVERLTADASGAVSTRLELRPGAAAFAISWRGRLARTSPTGGTRVEVRARDGSVRAATCTVTAAGALAVAVGDPDLPQRTRELGPSYGDFAFTLVVRDGRMTFRAVSATGRAPLFQEEVRIPGLSLVQLDRVSLPKVDAADLVIE